MKLVSRRIALSGALLFASSTSPVFASANDLPWNSFSNSLSDITQYLLNLGQYLGYNLEQSPEKAENVAVSQALLQVTSDALTGIMLPTLKSVFGALPVNTAGVTTNETTTGTSGSSSPPYFVPSNLEAFVRLNDAGNSTFISAGYSNPTNNISVSTLIDQPTGGGAQKYQSDPVSQSIANMLMTPDYSYCLTNDASAWAECSYITKNPQMMNNNQIMQNVIGNIPSTDTFFTPSANLAVIPQLNSNSLIAPLMYSTTSTGTPQPETTVDTATTLPTSKGSPGPLQAQNPAQQAANFIRYATAAVSPIPLPSRSTYDALYEQVQNTDLTVLQRFQAASNIANFLTNIRVYAAQTSVGISNLYYILSKRMPQPIVGEGNQSTTTSQALSEYTMATWRLARPDLNQQGNSDWVNKLNTASAATMQKEIAVLLAEINYQLYLNRQQEERLLLTNSMLLLQNARTTQLEGLLRATADTATSNSSSSD
ncbi:type IVB secretion system protein IcmX [Legionella brunensis]|uniref:Intracellular multiplication protein IcmX n=1 Tax=Legionella brunensis TaxID=29422 RepID=A0A0W0SQB6_9GAMM|nr:type IVB secretion system protein IcmX [Legionella brunensis]KTC85189.1 intracellular multiplication protein IcmX [Legionella brunensis]